jgi:hypothetical protein
VHQKRTPAVRRRLSCIPCKGWTDDNASLPTPHSSVILYAGKRPKTILATLTLCNSGGASPMYDRSTTTAFYDSHLRGSCPILCLDRLASKQERKEKESHKIFPTMNECKLDRNRAESDPATRASLTMKSPTLAPPPPSNMKTLYICPFSVVVISIPATPTPGGSLRLPFFPFAALLQMAFHT